MPVHYHLDTEFTFYTCCYQSFFSRLIKIAFNKALCGKCLKKLHNNILRPQNKPINDSNLLLKNREFPSTRAFLQQTNISAEVFPETLRIPTNNSRQTNILYQNFFHQQYRFCGKQMFSIKAFPEKPRIPTNVINKTIFSAIYKEKKKNANFYQSF